MILLLCIIGCTLLVFALMIIFGATSGSIIAFGILLGCLVRGLYLISRIHNHLSPHMPKKDKVAEAYRRYVEEGK